MATNESFSPVVRQALSPALSEQVEHLLSFADPATLGGILQEFGWTPNEDIEILVEISRDPTQPVKYRLAALCQLRGLINDTLKRATTLTQVKTIQNLGDGRQVHVTQVAGLVSRLRQTGKEMTHAPQEQTAEPSQRLVDHKPPAAATLGGLASARSRSPACVPLRDASTLSDSTDDPRPLPRDFPDDDPDGTRSAS